MRTGTRRIAKLSHLVLASLLASCAAGSSSPGPERESTVLPRNSDNLLIVDCLLPAQIRKLGTKITYLAPRRNLKTAAVDCEIRGGEYVAGDRANYATALRVWLEPAQEGEPRAQTYVGEIYEKGLGLEADYETALTWYQRAADQGYAPAQINLGHLYEEGLGVERDLVQALSWYRRASGFEELDFVASGESREFQNLPRGLALAGPTIQVIDPPLSTTSSLSDFRRDVKVKLW